MTTVADALVTTIDAQWGNGGGGGVKPTIVSKTGSRSEGRQGHNPKMVDQITIWLPVESRRKPVNDTYTDVEYTVTVRVETKTSIARQEEIYKELRWIINNVAITGVNEQYVESEADTTDPRGHVLYRTEVKAKLRTYLEVSATAYSAGVTANFAVTGNLSVTGTSTLSGAVSATTSVTTPIVDTPLIQDAAAIAIKPSGDTDDYIELSTDSNVPTITVIGSPTWVLKSDNAAAVQLIAREDTSNQINLRWDKTNTKGIIRATADILIQADGDNDDYWYFSTAGNIASMLPIEDKVHNIGSAVLSADHVYADDFDNTSPFEVFADPISALKKIVPNKELDKLDYTTLPDFVRTHTRASKNAPKDILAPEGWSVNRMVILLYQALQKAVERIEELEKT